MGLSVCEAPILYEFLSVNIMFLITVYIFA